MISTSSILKTFTLSFKKEGWSITHFYIYRPSMIEPFGIGDRSNTSSYCIASVGNGKLADKG
jgi:hypothetical protein